MSMYVCISPRRGVLLRDFQLSELVLRTDSTWFFGEYEPALLLEIETFDQLLCIGEGGQKLWPPKDDKQNGIIITFIMFLKSSYDKQKFKLKTHMFF